MGSVSESPARVSPEITLREVVLVPPTRFAGAELVISTPSRFATAMAPVTSGWHQAMEGALANIVDPG